MAITVCFDYCQTFCHFSDIEVKIQVVNEEMFGLSELSHDFIGNIVQFADVKEFYQLERVSHQWQKVMASYFQVEKELMKSYARFFQGRSNYFNLKCSHKNVMNSKQNLLLE